MNHIRSLAALLVAIALSAQSSVAQTPAKDPSARLREVLPADVAQRVPRIEQQVGVQMAHQVRT